MKSSDLMVQLLFNSGFKKHYSVLREASHKYSSFLCQNYYSTCTSQVRKDEQVEGYALKLSHKISHIFVWLLITTTSPTHFPAQHVYKKVVRKKAKKHPPSQMASPKQSIGRNQHQLQSIHAHSLSPQTSCTKVADSLNHPSLTLSVPSNLCTDNFQKFSPTIPLSFACSN